MPLPMLTAAILTAGVASRHILVLGQARSLVCACTATFTQMAGIAALEGPQGDVDMMVAAGCEFSRLHGLCGAESATGVISVNERPPARGHRLLATRCPRN